VAVEVVRLLLLFDEEEAPVDEGTVTVEVVRLLLIFDDWVLCDEVEADVDSAERGTVTVEVVRLLLLLLFDEEV